MATVTFEFDLRRIPDRCLNLLLRGAGEGSRPKTILVRSVYDLLVQERLLRDEGAPGPESPHTVESGLPRGDAVGIRATLANLQRDVADLEYASGLSGPVEAAELQIGAEFLFRVGESLKGLKHAAWTA